MAAAIEIQQLSKLISDSVATLLKATSDAGVELPHLNESFAPPSEAFRGIPAAADAANIIGTAALQLAIAVLPPFDSLFQVVTGPTRSAALRVCVECHVPELLREAGPEGLSAQEIGARCGVDGSKIGRLLRALANRHIFREVTPDVFTNNRLSSLLDTRKSFEALKADPFTKHHDTPGFVALVEYFLSDGHTATAHLLENMKDPKTAFSGEPNHAPVQKALGTDLDLFQFMELPEQRYRHQRFGVAMGGVKAMEHPDVINNAYDWASLPRDAVVVDVAGGIGNAALSIVQSAPQVSVVVQEVPSVLAEARIFWKRENPEALSSGHVRLQVHDFFTPQPIKNASVFLLKNILHDWSDSYNVKILTHLRAAATPSTVLVIVGNIMDYTCLDTDQDAQSISGSSFKPAPAPLLPNYGIANEMAYNLDLAMLNWHNAQEYTVKGLRELLAQAGWKLSHVTRRDPPGNFLGSAQAVPI
ncbi:S-adenosyl-L-methionine-dependent methyltransferase [Pluteus cervinus]|uniref:S-adenosyl-L-methionine-dependent methyltransferase n=1 Tax=Pluteus cervinus TaxID=181527 RepID=A0ACD3AID3_9AGAR|nr:S-adenosyl-L-methionine-dependent methyltransferase [Pluteus cervinus]